MKKVAGTFLARVRAIVTVKWRMTAQARARVREAVEQALDDGLPRAYTPDVFEAKAGPWSSTCQAARRTGALRRDVTHPGMSDVTRPGPPQGAGTGSPIYKASASAGG